ncbi:hypothetical protein QWZ08_23865 [Ferruginibacter paludis]|uniref:hypothetical protein n=1 Tax=Ferruginibacter paludis TaxID=1310417 RepID=UPI0025B4D2FC|nr:hypothetical protein [Ferruginibacter paludis]MDN3658700.1 hypothetical protein [Ferruginibacter paludis]
MNIDNIQLTPFLIQELFKNSLVESDNPEPVKKPDAAASFAILGHNRKKIIILVANDETLYLPDEQLNFLLGILSACSLTMEDVAIINTRKNKNITYKAIEQELKGEKVILFGVTPAQINLPIEFPQYQVQAFNSQTYLTAAMLPEIQENKAEKARLWNCLKQIFSI